MMDQNVMSVSRKRKRDEKESHKKMKIVVGIMTTIMTVVTAWYHDKFLRKEPSCDWDQERGRYFARLYDGTERNCIEQLRVSKKGFLNICKALQDDGGLVRTRHVPIKEAVAMFLYILAHNKKYRVLGFDCFRSKETISRQFHNVLRAFMRLSKKYIKFHERVTDSATAQKWKWFEVNDEDENFRYKEIPNWDDIVDLCGKDRATGEGAETAMEASDVMSTEASSSQEIDDLVVLDDDSSTPNKNRAKGKRGMASSNSVDLPPKRRVGDDLAAAVTVMADSLKSYMQSSKIDVNEIYAEVNSIPGLDRKDRLRALNWLVDNENKFLMLQKLSLEEKKDFLLMCLP